MTSTERKSAADDAMDLYSCNNISDNWNYFHRISTTLCVTTHGKKYIIFQYIQNVNADKFLTCKRNTTLQDVL